MRERNWKMYVEMFLLLFGFAIAFVIFMNIWVWSFFHFPLLFILITCLLLIAGTANRIWLYKITKEPIMQPKRSI